MEQPQGEIHWKASLEVLVQREAEKSLALRWSHDEAQRWTATWNTRFQFITILLSTFSGAGAVGSATILPFDGATTLVGVISLVVSTLQTLSNYLAFAKRSEAHRFASLSYGKLHSQLALQLALPRNERLTAATVIDMIKTETERLAEVSPQLPQIIKEKFHTKFKDTTTAVPTVLNGLEEVKITPEIPSPMLNFTPKPVVNITV